MIRRVLILMLVFAPALRADSVDVVIKGERKTESLTERLTPSTTMPIEDIFPLATPASDPLLHPAAPAVTRSSGTATSLQSRMPLSPYLPEIPSQTIAAFYPPDREKTVFWHLKLTDSRGDLIQEWFSQGQPPESIAWDGKDRAHAKRLVRVGEHYSFLYDARLGSEKAEGPKISKVFRVTGTLEETEGGTIITLASGVLLDQDNALTPEGRRWLRSACDEAKKRYGRKLKLVLSSKDGDAASSKLSILSQAFQDELQLKPEELETAAEKSYVEPAVVKLLLVKKT